jgi:hypothetical protein
MLLALHSCDAFGGDDHGAKPGAARHRAQGTIRRWRTWDFLQLRTSEADKIRCGQQHFATLGVPFAVAVSADEV